MINCRVVDAN
jgi:hypothetical protein